MMTDDLVVHGDDGRVMTVVLGDGEEPRWMSGLGKLAFLCDKCHIC